MLSFLGFGSNPAEEQATQQNSMSELVDEKSHMESEQFSGEPPAPTFALENLRRANVPLNVQMMPYLQMDPSIFKESQPQYIMPEPGSTGRGKFEHSFGNIGGAVLGGFGVGCARGFSGDVLHMSKAVEIKNMPWRPYFTRLTNATMKHGSGYAQVAGSAVLIYCGFDVILNKAYGDNILNSVVAGGIAGALFRSPHGLQASAMGAGMGLALSVAWILSNRDSRERFQEMLHFA
ncbi:hypothetical protein DdX_16314 [Ditylenchus destructor]|uniref:Uncharacterized protein n=1 Tax=Ditylenchus destructor TaxID=166010 RepID=A0AAD4MTC3_9BILA|nr:hypothetical protein DdX_16314 [Ditylenchus destructor]